MNTLYNQSFTEFDSEWLPDMDQVCQLEKYVAVHTNSTNASAKNVNSSLGACLSCREDFACAWCLPTLGGAQAGYCYNSANETCIGQSSNYNSTICASYLGNVSPWAITLAIIIIVVLPCLCCCCCGYYFVRRCQANRKLRLAAFVQQGSPTIFNGGGQGMVTTATTDARYSNYSYPQPAQAVAPPSQYSQPITHYSGYPASAPPIAMATSPPPQMGGYDSPSRYDVPK